MSYITAIGTANPINKFSQAAIADFMVKAMHLDDVNARRLKTIFRASGIDTRHSVLEDYGKENAFTFYSNAHDFEPFPSTEKRLKAFRDYALPLSLRAVEDLRKSVDFISHEITHLILVCCTGMYAPGLDIDLVRELNLPPTTNRTSITFMGCYAAFNALKVADAVCKADPQSKVLVVCTELCSLHFQKMPSDDNLLANALFADGAAALLIEAVPNGNKRLKIESFHNDIVPGGQEDMAWTIGDLGFEMRLSIYVPDIIQKGITNLATSLLAKINKKITDIRYFAIHPGGRKILETIEKQLGLSQCQNEDAYEVLRNFGNMSSPTVLFVLKRLFQKFSVQDNDQHILSFAFGPGVTLESMILKIEMEHA